MVCDGDRKVAFGANVTLAILFVLLGACTLTSAAFRQSGKPDVCGQIQLPAKMKLLLERSYGAWTIQNEGLLSKTARERWSAEMPLACPGAVAGAFFPGRSPEYVFLLVPLKREDSGYRVIAVGDESRAEVIESWDGEGSSNYFLQKVRTADYFSREKAKKFQPQSKDSFLLIDSAEHEYGADLYFWTGGRFRNDPVDE